MDEYLIIAGIVLFVLGLAVYFYCRKREAEASSRQSNAMLNDLMTAEIMMKNSALNSYKAMLRQPRIGPPPSELTWDVTPSDRRRF